MNLLNELLTTAKQNAAEISASQDAILATVKENLALEKEADLDYLRHFGVHKILTEAKETKSSMEKIIAGDYLTEEDIETVCKKYALKCLPTKYYKNEIPLKALNDMRKFENENRVKFIGHDGRGNNLFIVAPQNHFKLTTRPQVDPVLLYKENYVYRVISSWGSDFNNTQRAKGFWQMYSYIILSVILACISTALIAHYDTDDKGLNKLGILFLYWILSFLVALIISIVILDSDSSYNEPYK